MEAPSNSLLFSLCYLGKTFSFLVPTLARLVYPPDVFPEDLRGPQAIIVVPTMELGVQVRPSSRSVTDE